MTNWLVVSCQLSVVSCQLSVVIGYWLLVIGYWLLVLGYWSVVSCQLQKNIFLPCPLPPAPCLLPIPVAEYWNKQTQ